MHGYKQLNTYIHTHKHPHKKNNKYHTNKTGHQNHSKKINGTFDISILHRLFNCTEAGVVRVIFRGCKHAGRCSTRVLDCGLSCVYSDVCLTEWSRRQQLCRGRPISLPFPSLHPRLQLLHRDLQKFSDSSVVVRCITSGDEYRVSTGLCWTTLLLGAMKTTYCSMWFKFWITTGLKYTSIMSKISEYNINLCLHYHTENTVLLCLLLVRSYMTLSWQTSMTGSG